MYNNNFQYNCLSEVSGILTLWMHLMHYYFIIIIFVHQLPCSNITIIYFSVDSRYLEACQELLIGPQYLNRGRIGAQEFLEGVDKLFNCCINNCAQEDVPSLLAWQVRWWSYIFQHSFNASQDLDLSKQFRTKAKALLKKHRQCLPLYTEYALYEAQVGW